MNDLQNKLLWVGSFNELETYSATSAVQFVEQTTTTSQLFLVNQMQPV